MKEYKINTIEDIINCTNSENLDNFLKDFRGILESYHAIKNLSKSINENAEIKTDGFVWIDDGKHNITVEFNSEKLNYDNKS